LYVCKLEGGIWGQPNNLGPVINTAGNEVYPAFQNNDVLFFASDGRHGMGGLDVYRTSVRNGKWQTSQNLGEPINSANNDFGLAYVGEFSGIFSSDREGGKGGYELYRFRQRTDAQVIHLRGVYASDQPGNAPVALELVDINGKVVDRAKVDARGEFLFKRLSIDDHYLIRVPGADGPLPDDARIHFLDDLGRKVVLANRLDRSTFGFTALSRESMADLPKLDEVDETMLDRFALFGQVYRKLPGDPVKGLLVIARDREGNELERTYTDHEGKFSFRDLSADQFALVALEAEDEGLHLRLFDANNHVALEGPGNNGRFRFEQLAADENLLHRIYQPEDAELPQETVVASGIFEYRGKPAANVRINLLDRFRRIVQRTTTDERGHFRFAQLHPEEHYLVMLDEQDKHIPEDARMYLIDEQGRETLLAERLKRGLFSFRTLSQDEQPSLAHEEEKDASRAAFQVYGQVYEKLPGDFTTTMTVYALDDLGNIVETAQTL
ncbi:MAG: carboxypeptidase-like regulatory domain-containing protein, partial [Bacteroidota bacterium]